MLVAKTFVTKKELGRLPGKPMPPHAVMAANKAEQRLSGLPSKQFAHRPAIARNTGVVVHANRQFVARPHKC
ncbi:hypothetical protein ACG04R_14900 [Roseateles sp. BYS78W]|uniref:Uncharacterized protein n=1 Tax=Pelomonas candidula TaxID=3299025 RepID=A0ABW7HDI1_9BURK